METRSEIIEQANRANAETVKLLAEANESRARQLTELEKVGVWLQRSLTEEAEKLRLLEEALRERQARFQTAEKQRLEAQAQQHHAGLANAQTQNAKLQQENSQLRSTIAALDGLLWPAAIRDDSWRTWRECLVQRAGAEPSAAALLGRLHLAAALETGGRSAGLELIRDLGRSVYETCPDDAPRLAQALSQGSAGRFEIRTVRAGDRVDNKFMKAASAGLTEVRAPAGWAVRDNNGVWQFPADVS
jgi:hypothetical protein